MPWGYVGGVQCDPIEKKPFFHARPGSLAFSFGMLGCDLHCSYCQNWVTSQALRDPQAIAPPLDVAPAALVAEAMRLGAQVVVSTYNEPLITSEWAVAIFKEARAARAADGVTFRTATARRGCSTTSGRGSTFTKSISRASTTSTIAQLGGRLEPILSTIRALHEMGIWLEIVTLLIPGFNDSQDEIERLTAFIAGVSTDIPWHVTAFHKDYRMNDPENTTPEMLVHAAEIGAAEWPALRLCRQPARAGRRSRKHALPRMPRDAGRTIRLLHPAATGSRRTASVRIAALGFLDAGAAKFDGQIASSPFLPGTRRLRIL